MESRVAVVATEQVSSVKARFAVIFVVVLRIDLLCLLSTSSALLLNHVANNTAREQNAPKNTVTSDSIDQILARTTLQEREQYKKQKQEQKATHLSRRTLPSLSTGLVRLVHLLIDSCTSLTTCSGCTHSPPTQEHRPPAEHVSHRTEKRGMNQLCLNRPPASLSNSLGSISLVTERTKLPGSPEILNPPPWEEFYSNGSAGLGSIERQSCYLKWKHSVFVSTLRSK